jgi:ribosome biogenesis GTPase
MFPDHLFRLGWNLDRQSQLQALDDSTLVPARIAVQHRGAYGLLGCSASTGHLAGRFHLDGDATRLPAVGDWVAVRPAGDLAIIHAVLPRQSLLERRRPGSAEAVEAQAIAANLDVVFIVAVATPGRGLNLRRAERYLAAVLASGARPVLVLNKADLVAPAAAEAALVELATLAPGVSCLATSAFSGDGVADLRGALGSGGAALTAAFVGPSGVGKSSLVNRVLGDARQSTALVRLTDDKGRHTTTRRELIELPEGGALIDTPGMREFGLVDAGAGIDETFAEVEALAHGCRFRDCAHRGEPGCAVAEALARGELGEDRLASFDKLRREEAFAERRQDPRSQAASKGRWKVIHKQQRARRRVDPKLRDD